MKRRSLVYTHIITSSYLPEFPNNIVKIFSLLGESNTNIDELASVIEEEEVLTKLILDNLNKNGQPLRKRITNIKDALLYWGIVSARNIIIFFITHAFYPKKRIFSLHFSTGRMSWQLA